LHSIIEFSIAYFADGVDDPLLNNERSPRQTPLDQPIGVE
jgi:hypothetical protein